MIHDMANSLCSFPDDMKWEDEETLVAITPTVRDDPDHRADRDPRLAVLDCPMIHGCAENLPTHSSPCSITVPARKSNRRPALAS
jgi:hypothetical protein